MLPYAIPALVLAAFLALVLALGYDLGMAVPFAFLWPAFTVWLMVAAISGLAVTVARAIALCEGRPGSSPGRSDKGETY